MTNSTSIFVRIHVTASSIIACASPWKSRRSRIRTFSVPKNNAHDTWADVVTRRTSRGREATPRRASSGRRRRRGRDSGAPPADLWLPESWRGGGNAPRSRHRGASRWRSPRRASGRSAGVRPRRRGLRPPRSTFCRLLTPSRTKNRPPNEYGRRFCGGTTTRSTSPRLSTSTPMGGSAERVAPSTARLQLVVVPHAERLASIGDAEQDDPAAGVRQRAQRPADVLGQRPLELDRRAFPTRKHTGEFGMGGHGHTAISPVIRRGRSASRTLLSRAVDRFKLRTCRTTSHTISENLSTRARPGITMLIARNVLCLFPGTSCPSRSSGSPRLDS